MEEALYEITSLRSFSRLSLNEPIPDETTILNFRHLLEANDLAEDILKFVNAYLCAKPMSRFCVSRTSTYDNLRFTRVRLHVMERLVKVRSALGRSDLITFTPRSDLD